MCCRHLLGKCLVFLKLSPQLDLSDMQKQFFLEREEHHQNCAGDKIFERLS